MSIRYLPSLQIQFSAQCVQQSADVNYMFLDCRPGPTLSCLVAEKGKFSHQLLFSHANKAFWSSQPGGGEVKEGYCKSWRWTGRSGGGIGGEGGC